jgi:hypothetical protein
MRCEVRPKENGEEGTNGSYEPPVQIQGLRDPEGEPMAESVKPGFLACDILEALER